MKFAIVLNGSQIIGKVDAENAANALRLARMQHPALAKRLSVQVVPEVV